MNCKEAHLMIASVTGTQLPDALAEHVRDCAACADLLAVDARLRATLRSSETAPSPFVLGRIREEVARPVRVSWSERFRENTLMKLALPATALFAIALVALPRPVAAATPLATFAKMKKAILGRARQATPIEVRIGQRPDRSIGTWVVVDGQLTEVPQNGTFSKKLKNGEFTVTHSNSEVTDLSSLPPEIREKVRKAIENAKKNGKGNGSAHVETIYQVDGKEVDEATAQARLRESGIDLKISLDLDEGHYRSIAFGTDRNHLVLSPKAAQGRRYVVALDPATSLPRDILLEKNARGRWIAAKRSNVVLR